MPTTIPGKGPLPPNKLVQIFVSGAFSYWENAKFEVAVLLRFIELLKGLSREKSGIVIDNVVMGRCGVIQGYGTREGLQKQMTSADIFEAMGSARTCMSSDYRNCR